MKMIVEKLVDGVQEFEVVEADNASQAINQCSRNALFEDEGNPFQENQEVEYIGVYELGRVNLLEAVTKNVNTHRFYHNKIKQLGFDPITYEKL